MEKSSVVKAFLLSVTFNVVCVGVGVDATLDRKTRPISLQKFSWKCVKGGRCVRNGETLIRKCSGPSPMNGLQVCR